MQQPESEIPSYQIYLIFLSPDYRAEESLKWDETGGINLDEDGDVQIEVEITRLGESQRQRAIESRIGELFDEINTASELIVVRSNKKEILQTAGIIQVRVETILRLARELPEEKQSKRLDYTKF